MLDGIDVELVIGDDVPDSCANRCRSAFCASAAALRSRLSASIRAFIRASSSFSSCFFFRRASRAACCAVDTEDLSGLGSGGFAFCLPFAFEEGGSIGDTGMCSCCSTASSRGGGRSSSRVGDAGLVVAAGSSGGDVAADAFAVGIGAAPSNFRTLLTNSSSLTPLDICSCSCPLCMTTKVGVFEMGQNAARKPASVEPASSRRTTAFCSRRPES